MFMTGHHTGLKNPPAWRKQYGVCGVCVSAGIGLGANVLFGGSDRTFARQPMAFKAVPYSAAVLRLFKGRVEPVRAVV